jgi:outer membrane protein TolC
MIPLLSLALAATPITLDEVKQRSRDNVQALLSALDRDRALSQVTLARSSLYPQVSLSLGGGYTKAGTQTVTGTVPSTGTATGYESAEVDVPGYSRGSFNFNVFLNQTIVDLGRWAQLDQAGASAEAAKGQVLDQQDASELEAIRRFYVLYSAQESLKLLGQNVQRSEEQVRQAQGLYEAGRGSKADVISAQINLGNDKISLIKQRSTIASAQSDLATWLALPGVTDLVAQEPPSLKAAPAPAPALDTALEDARDHRAILAAWRARMDAADAGIRAARAGYYPKLTGQLSYSRNGPSFDPVFTDPTKQNVISGSLNLQWDLFSGFSTGAQVSQASADKESAQLNLQETEREIQGSVRSALEALSAQQEALSMAKENLGRAEQFLEVAQERYRAGAGTQLEVRDAELKLTSAQLQLLQTRTDVEVARATLARAVGALNPGETK